MRSFATSETPQKSTENRIYPPIRLQFGCTVALPAQERLGPRRRIRSLVPKLYESSVQMRHHGLDGFELIRCVRLKCLKGIFRI